MIGIVVVVVAVVVVAVVAVVAVVVVAVVAVVAAVVADVVVQLGLCTKHSTDNNQQATNERMCHQNQTQTT